MCGPTDSLAYSTGEQANERKWLFAPPTSVSKLTHSIQFVWLARRRNFNGFISIRDFIVTAWQYCSFDKDRIAELAFRLISRRGDVFDPNITIVDLEDLVTFVDERYNPLKKKNSKSVRKTAVNIFSFIDVDESGGVQYDEFIVFCKQNPIFLYYAHWLSGVMRSKIFGDQYWRDATNDRPDIFSRDVMQESLMRDNITEQGISIGMYGKDMQKKKGNKYKVDFPEAWYAQKEKAFNMKQKLKNRQDLASQMAKQTYARMIKVFTRLVPDSLGIRPAFNIWKDLTDYQRSLEEDGGETYALNNMSLMDVQDAVKAQSCGLSTDKLLALKKNEADGDELNVHEQVLKESASGVPSSFDVFSENSSSYLAKISANHDNKFTRICKLSVLRELIENVNGPQALDLYDSDDNEEEEEEEEEDEEGEGHAYDHDDRYEDDGGDNIV